MRIRREFTTRFTYFVIYIPLGLQRLAHAAKCDTLDREEFINAVLTALTAETALLNTTKPRSN